MEIRKLHPERTACTGEPPDPACPAATADHRAFQIIYQHHKQPTLDFIRFCHPSLDPDTAQDVLSEVFLSVWDQHSHMRTARNVSTYLRGIARNVLADRHRKPPEPTPQPPDDAQSKQLSVLAAIEHSQLTRQVISAVQSLTKSHHVD